MLPIIGSLGLVGLLGLTISATNGLFAPVLIGTPLIVTLPPLSRSPCVISFSPTLLPSSSLMTTLSPTLMLPSVGTVTMIVVVPVSLSPPLFSASVSLPSLLASSSNSIPFALSGTLVLSSTILPIVGSLGLSGLLGLTISAVIVLSPGFTGTSGTLTLPLSMSSLVISFSPTLFPSSSLMTTLSPGFTLPSFGSVTSTVVLP